MVVIARSNHRLTLAHPNGLSAILEMSLQFGPVVVLNEREFRQFKIRTPSARIYDLIVLSMSLPYSV
jgi:hypothetical protein